MSMEKKRLTALFRPKAEQAAPATAGTAASAGIPGEVIAAISAAVAVMCGAGARIVGVKPARSENRGRTAWAMAGALENTRPF
jgi:hypothetical protein